MLTLHSLSRQSPGGLLFDGVGVTLLPGCLLQLKGANGSGKTRLLEMIAGVESVPEGHIHFAGQETRGDVEFFGDLIYVSQSQDALPKRYTVRKYLQKLAKRLNSPVLDGAIRFFDLEGVLDQRISTLTPGWRQRLLLAPLIMDPCAIWLLDRPFQSLDEEGKMKLEHLIAGRCQQNGIVVVVHDDDTRLNPHHRLNMDDWRVTTATLERPAK